MKKCAKCGKQIKEGTMAYCGGYYHYNCYEELFNDDFENFSKKAVIIGNAKEMLKKEVKNVSRTKRMV